jgi:hypothetical protein
VALVISNHWAPLHRGNIGPWTDADVMRQWGPPTVKIVWDGAQIPYLEDIPAGAKILWRNYPLSEQFHSGLDLGDARSLTPISDYPYRPLSTHGQPQNGSGRDVYQLPTTRGLSDLPTPEQAAAAYVQNAIAVAGDADSKGIALSRLLFEGPNEYPVWAHGYLGLARLEKRRLELMHQRLPACGCVVSNLGVGWPGNTGPDTPPVWDWFAPVAAAFGPNDFLGAHEYTGFGGPQENWGWWTGRILKCPYKLPILITECLVDGGVYGAAHAKQGYRNYPDMDSEDAKAQRYVDELWAYAKLIGADGRVREIMPYTYDGNRADWANFDIRTETFLRTFLARIANEGLPQPGTAPVIPPVTPPPPAYLPESEPIMAVGKLADKCRWWLEESIRQDEAGNQARAEAIRYSLIKRNGGLFYRLENALKAGQPQG